MKSPLDRIRELLRRNPEPRPQPPPHPDALRPIGRPIGPPSFPPASSAGQTVESLPRVPSPYGQPTTPLPEFYSNGYQLDAQTAPEAERGNVFDPSLSHFRHGFRLADPAFPEEERTQEWFVAREFAMEHVLRMCAESPWSQHLVLRGSLLMKAWFGDAARRPGDIDWVIVPPQLTMTGPEGSALINGIADCIQQPSDSDGLLFNHDGIAVDEIWTYERVPGTRLTLPWLTSDLPGGVVQMDFVFGEALPLPPALTHIPTSTGEIVEAWAATPELALAWKLLWLETDMYPQGKDLYDAVLLAERTTIPLPLLEQVLHQAEYPPARKLEPDFPMEWVVDWDNFRLEYPSIAGDAAYWQERLTRALAPMFPADSA